MPEGRACRFTELVDLAHVFVCAGQRWVQASRVLVAEYTSHERDKAVAEVAANETRRSERACQCGWRGVRLFPLLDHFRVKSY